MWAVYLFLQRNRVSGLIAAGSDIVDSVLLVRKRLAFHAEVRVYDQIAREYLCRHDLALLGVYDLLPRVRRVGHDESELEAEFFHGLPVQAHHLSDGEVVHYFLRVKDYFATDRFAFEHGRGELHFDFLAGGEVPLAALPEDLASLRVFHPQCLDPEFSIIYVVNFGWIKRGHLLDFLWLGLCAPSQHILQRRTVHVFPQALIY